MLDVIPNGTEVEFGSYFSDGGLINKGVGIVVQCKYGLYSVYDGDYNVIVCHPNRQHPYDYVRPVEEEN